MNTIHVCDAQLSFVSWGDYNDSTHYSIETWRTRYAELDQIVCNWSGIADWHHRKRSRAVRVGAPASGDRTRRDYSSASDFVHAVVLSQARGQGGLAREALSAAGRLCGRQVAASIFDID